MQFLKEECPGGSLEGMRAALARGEEGLGVQVDDALFRKGWARHLDPIFAGRPAFCQKLRENKMTRLKRTCFKHLTLVRQVDIK